MDAVNHWSWWWIFPAVVAAGVVGGGAFEATRCVIDWAHRRRT